ncbi:MAG: phosphoribulokinase [Gammaproteobacteria bacterium]|nr:phosphoribulokinase [Gammaproteobacteria bacterium]
MSKKHPIVAVTGSSGAGTSGVKTAFEFIFRDEGVIPAFIEGDSFHRYNRKEMDVAVKKAQKENSYITHFGPEGNLFKELEDLFKGYGESGKGMRRYYVHNEEEAIKHDSPPGTLTSWQELPEKTDLLFYEGLHGGLVTDSINIAQHVDLLIGVVPIVNLEWMQKIYRDQAVRGYSAEDATRMILSRLPDYVHYITPQFSRTDINFQRVPLVDTSNPFAFEHIPSNDQSLSVIHIRNPQKLQVDFRYLLEMLDGSVMSAPDTIVVPAGKNIFAMQLIINPLIQRMMHEREKSWDMSSK